MKLPILFSILFFATFSFAQLPEGFVYVKDIIPDLDVELRYATTNNFIGKPIDGYQSNHLILTEQTANALKLIQQELQMQNLCLKVYDGYRPQRAVNHFMHWARELNDTINKQQFYPNVDKRNLFIEAYIATRSGHSKGSTVDVTLIEGNSGKSLDMGSAYDFFGVESWVNYENISLLQKKNRQLLQAIMLKHGFINYPREWWHFTLKDEPFPNTYFDFLVE